MIVRAKVRIRAMAIVAAMAHSSRIRRIEQARMLGVASGYPSLAALAPNLTCQLVPPSAPADYLLEAHALGAPTRTLPVSNPAKLGYNDDMVDNTTRTSPVSNQAKLGFLLGFQLSFKLGYNDDMVDDTI